MKYCRYCGIPIEGAAAFCVYCGTAAGPRPAPLPVEKDKPSAVLNALCFFIPIMGLILYLALKKHRPQKARACGKASLGMLYFILAISCIAAFVYISIKFLLPLLVIGLSSHML